MARSVYKYRIDLGGKEKQLLRQAKKKGRKDARLVIRMRPHPAGSRLPTCSGWSSRKRA